MILKASIVGMLVVLVIVVYLSCMTHEEGFSDCPLPTVTAMDLSVGQVFKCMKKDAWHGKGVGKVYQYVGQRWVMETTLSPTVKVLDCSALKFTDNLPSTSTVSSSGLTNGQIFSCITGDITGGKGAGTKYQYFKNGNAVTVNESTLNPIIKLSDCSTLTFTAAAPTSLFQTTSNLLQNGQVFKCSAAGDILGGNGGTYQAIDATHAFATSLKPTIEVTDCSTATARVTLCSSTSTTSRRDDDDDDDDDDEYKSNQRNHRSLPSILLNSFGGQYRPNASAAAYQPAAPAAQPQRNNIRPQVSLSDTSQQAMHMKQQSDFLKDLQTVIRNELRLARATDSSAVASTSETSDSCGDSAALSQGNEYTSNMINKDSVPCWGCSLDY